MQKKWTLLLAASLSVGVLAGCKSGGSSSTAPEKDEPVAATKPSIPIPADSPFAKIKVGMDKDEVFAKIGPPTNIGTYQTGKAWIPFHFSGSDNYHMVARYKGQGTITFSNDSAYTSGMSVIEIDYDPTELGYEKKTD
jgi:hypothetical protein